MISQKVWWSTTQVTGNNCVPTEVLTLTPKHQQYFVHEDADQEEVATPQPRMPETNIFDNLHRDALNPWSPPIPDVVSTPPCATEVEKETPQDTCTEDDEEQVRSQKYEKAATLV